MNTKRTHRLLPMAIALVMALSLLPTKAWGYYVLQGSGTEASPYLISSAQALESLAEQVNDGALKTEGVYFRQTADIDLSGFKNNSWVPIGNATGSGGTGRTFDGIYDGNGFRIKNFVFEDTTRKYYGLFGLLSNTAVIKNLTLDKSCSVTARTYVGASSAAPQGPPSSTAPATPRCMPPVPPVRSRIPAWAVWRRRATPSSTAPTTAASRPTPTPAASAAPAAMAPAASRAWRG